MSCNRLRLSHPSTRVAVTLSFIACLTAWPAESQTVGGTVVPVHRPTQGKFTWVPLEWKPGLYWDVQSPRFVQLPGHGYPVTGVQEGHYLTRFEVEKHDDADGVRGGPLVSLRLSVSAEGRRDDSYQGQFFRIIVNPKTLDVFEIQEWVIEDGVEHLRDDAAYMPGSTRLPIGWPFGRGSLPDGLHFVWPRFWSSPDGIILDDIEPGPNSATYQRVSDVTSTSASLTIAYANSTMIVDGRDPDVRLDFENGKPWYQVRLLDGRSPELVNPIVEIGNTP